MDLKKEIKEMDWYDLMLIIKERIEGEDVYIEGVACQNGNYELDMFMIYQAIKDYE